MAIDPGRECLSAPEAHSAATTKLSQAAAGSQAGEKWGVKSDGG